jgi:hypothetical protein
MAFGSRSDPTRSGIISATCYGRTVHNIFIVRTRTEKGAVAQKLVDLGASEAEAATAWAEHIKNGNEHGDAKRPVTRGQDDHRVHDEESIVVNKPDAAGARVGCVQRSSAAHAYSTRRFCR